MDLLRTKEVNCSSVFVVSHARTTTLIGGAGQATMGRNPMKRLYMLALMTVGAFALTGIMAQPLSAG
ncbi:MAG: hypothetical protein H6841_05330 [Planctomycetes bacterium]|nr:hypothetical protein [Planctomycetota bacterium]MCB9935036.1 hypothetical protein [Planctomycetota bacterium]